MKRFNSKIGDSKISSIQLFAIIFIITLIIQSAVYFMNNSLQRNFLSILLFSQGLIVLVAAFYYGIKKNLIDTLSTEIKPLNKIMAIVYLFILLIGSSLLAFQLYQKIISFEYILTSSTAIITAFFILDIVVMIISTILTTISVTYVTKWLLGFKEESGLAMIILSISIILGAVIFFIVS